MEDLPMISSIISTTLAVVAIWLSLHHKKESDGVNLITRDLLAKIREQAVNDRLLEEMTKNGDAVRAIAAAARDSNSVSAAARDSNSVSQDESINPKRLKIDMTKPLREFLGHIREIQSKTGGVTVVDLLVNLKPEINAPLMLGLIRSCDKKGLIEWDSQSNIPDSDEKVRLTKLGMELADKKE